MSTRLILWMCGLSLFLFAGIAHSGPGQGNKSGLNAAAKQELEDAGVNKYAGLFTPSSSTTEGLPDGWTRHDFDTANGDGPICIAGTPFSVFTRAQNPAKLLIFLEGGGACWQDFYFCNILSDAQFPLAPTGIWNADDEQNPFAGWSVMHVTYCDGSVYTGDNAVADANFPFGPVRHHRGLRNITAAVDLAHDVFPKAKNISVVGFSAGGMGAAINAPFLVRLKYGDKIKLSVLNDSGPVAINVNDIPAVEARHTDWQFEQFFPASCAGCATFGQHFIGLIEWRLNNDASIREGFYSTDGDAVDRFFMKIPTQAAYRDLLLTEHGSLNAANPDRYQRFIRSGSVDHGALHTTAFYHYEIDGFELHKWTRRILRPGKGWPDLVEAFAPSPF